MKDQSKGIIMKYLLQKRAGFTLVELLVVIAIIGILIGITLPAVQKIRSAAANMSCKSNLRQLGLGFAMYHDDNNQFPPGSTFLFNSNDWSPQYSHLAYLLPYLEQQALWDGLSNLELINPITKQFQEPNFLANETLRVFSCPADSQVNSMFPWPYPITTFTHYYGLTSYIGSSGYRNYGVTRKAGNGIFYAGSRVKILDITDGTSNTIMNGERPPVLVSYKSLFPYGVWEALYLHGIWHNYPLLGVRDRCTVNECPVRCETKIQHYQNGKIGDLCDAFHYWSLHEGGSNFLFADGSVHFLPYAADSILPALASRAGGEVIPDGFY